MAPPVSEEILMTITVEITPEAQAELIRQAAAHGSEIEMYAARLLKDAIHGDALHGTGSDPRETSAPAGSISQSALDWSRCSAVESIPGKVSGAWVFRDSRMPVAAVFENLEDGLTIEELMKQFPVTREQIESVLEFAARSLESRQS
jgi:uncharacterized protein (DUF433 family)